MSKKLPMVGNPYVENLQNAGVGFNAEVLAQLAIAHEQRTANLIALSQLTNPNMSPDYDMESIYNRLGLGENK